MRRERHIRPGTLCTVGLIRRVTRRIRQPLLFGLITFILLLYRSQNPAQDIQFLAFRARTGKQTAQFIHHLPRMVFTDKTGCQQRLFQMTIKTLQIIDQRIRRLFMLDLLAIS